jgi:hypothetical protein
MTEVEYAAYQAGFHQHADANAPKTPQGTVKKKGGRYGISKVEHNGIVFDSAHELRCWLKLCDRQARGEISDLKRQVSFELARAVDLGEKRKKKAMVYTADFTFIEGGALVVADAKGNATAKLPDYRMRKHLLADKYGHVIREM